MFSNANLEIFRQRLVELLNNSQLPVGVAYYIMKDVLIEVEKLYQQAINEDLKTPEETVEKFHIDPNNSQNNPDITQNIEKKENVNE